jgi:hypothetical protein
MLFAHLKRILRLGRLRLRGPVRVHPCRHRSKSPAPRQTDRSPTTTDGELRSVSCVSHSGRACRRWLRTSGKTGLDAVTAATRRLPGLPNRLLQQNRPIADFAHDREMQRVSAICQLTAREGIEFVARNLQF